MIWSPVERLPREELRALQLARLRTTFELDLDSLDDVAELPFTEQVRSCARRIPFGLLRVPVASLARLHASSGTHGKPTVVGYTRRRPRRVDRADGPLHDDGGRAARDARPQREHATACSPAATASTRAPSGSARPVLPVSGGFTARQAMLLHDLGAQVLSRRRRTRS